MQMMLSSICIGGEGWAGPRWQTRKCNGPPEKRGVLLSVPHWQPSPFALPKLQRQTSPPHPFDLWGHTPLTFRGQKYNLTALDFCRGLVQQMERGGSDPLPDKSSVLHEETFLTLISEKPWKRSGEIYL